jgi:alpha/beta superfamily hydrolase
LDECKAEKYKHIRLIGKSLGAIIASYYLESLQKEEQSKYSIVIFGYVTGSIDLNSFEGKIDIIQGEKDKFGNIDVVKNDLKDAVSEDISYFEIKNADHSYRNELKEPVFEDEAIEVFKCI